MIHMLVPGDWAARGICTSDSRPDDWFAERFERESYLRAKHMCRGCPVLAECLTYAQLTKEPHGIWGGLDPDERYNLRRNQLRRTIGSRRAIA